MEALKNIIESAWNDQELINQKPVIEAIEQVIELLDKGQLRIAEPDGDNWKVNEWINNAVVLYFPIR